MKLDPKCKSLIHGSDDIFTLFGPGGKRRHQHFRAFFAVQDPRINEPARKKQPNWKVKPLLDHLRKKFREGICLGENISLDEMTISFKGKHQDKLRINYKRAGDGFQCDAICEDGYCFDFIFRNEHPSPKYAEAVRKEDISKLHARCLDLFSLYKFKLCLIFYLCLDHLNYRYHKAKLDNLYTSSKFGKKALKSKNKVMIAGVICKENRGVPKNISQEE